MLISLLCTLLAALAAPRASPLIGRPLPALALSHPLQGGAFTGEDLLGFVVVLDVFQNGCPGCMTRSLPHAQELFARHAKDPRVRVVAIATAFEKDKYPAMGDEALMRQMLEQNKYRFPVMRDRDERSVKQVALEGTYGTPMTLVLDPEGIVRWHGFQSSEEASQQIDELVESLLREFDAPRIDELPDALKAYGGGAYGKAAQSAAGIAASESAPEDKKAAAIRVQEAVDGAIDRLLARAVTLRQNGRPSEARARLEDGWKKFSGAARAADIDAQLRAMRTDPAFRKELKAQEALEALLDKSTTNFAAIRPQLENLKSAGPETGVAARIDRLLALGG